MVYLQKRMVEEKIKTFNNTKCKEEVTGVKRKRCNTTGGTANTN